MLEPGTQVPPRPSACRPDSLDMHVQSTVHYSIPPPPAPRLTVPTPPTNTTSLLTLLLLLLLHALDLGHRTTGLPVFRLPRGRSLHQHSIKMNRNARKHAVSTKRQTALRSSDKCYDTTKLPKSAIETRCRLQLYLDCLPLPREG